MKIINIGMNHETAPVELRECLATDPENTVRALTLMRDLECIREGLFISTCNRVEALIATESKKEAENVPSDSFPTKRMGMRRKKIK